MSSETISQSINIVHPVTLSHGKNAEVWDTDGKRYIDFVGGIGVLNLGHCHPRIVEAIREQATRLTHYAFNAAPHAPYIELMDRLTAFIPVDYPVSGMLTNSGAEAAENALKIVRGATGRTAVIAFDGAFHGRTLATLNLNGKVAPYKQKVGVLPGPVYHLPFPSKDNGVTCAEALKAMDRLFSVEIDVDDVACFIVEPVQGEAGFLALDVEFAQALRRFCDEKNILLIADEIQSGFGRTGQRFAFSRLGIEPDLILLGKSIAGGVPLGAVVGRKSLLDTLPKGGLGGTYSGNPDRLRRGAGDPGRNDRCEPARLGLATGRSHRQPLRGLARQQAFAVSGPPDRRRCDARHRADQCRRHTGLGAIDAAAGAGARRGFAADAQRQVAPHHSAAGAVDHRGGGAGGRAGYPRGVPGKLTEAHPL